MAYLKTKHDLGITNVGTDGAGTAIVGMMLVKDKTNTPIYQVFDGKFLADQFFTNVPSQQYTDPEEEILLSQSDWRSGFGKEIYDSADPKRYYSSIGMDMRWDNMAIAGYAATTIAMPAVTAPTLIDGELDVWAASTLTNYTKTGSGVLSQVTGAGVHSGTSCAALTNAANTSQFYQDIAWSTAYQNRRFTLTGWCNDTTGVGSAGRIGLTDGAGTTWSAWQSDAGVWQSLSVSRTLSGTAYIRVICDAPVQNSTLYFDLLALTGTTPGVISAFAEFNNSLYNIQGTLVNKCGTAGTAFSCVWEGATNNTDLEPFPDNNLYVVCGTASGYYIANTADTFTASTTAVKNFQFFKTVHSSVPTMWGNDSVNTIRSNVTPASSAWSGTTAVGSNYYDITELVTKSGALYIMKEDMPYYLSSSGAVQNDLAPELTTLASSTSGKNTKVYKNELYIPCGAQSLLKSGTVNEFISPSSYCTNLADFTGRVMAVAYDDSYLFAAVDNLADTTKVEILAGGNDEVDGNTEWKWHPIAELTLAGVECMFVSNIVQKRLYIASATATDSLYYIPLPTGYGNITSDANRLFKNGSYMITPYLHGEFKSTNKAFIRLDMTLGHAYAASTYYTAAYQKVGDTDWTTIGNMIGTSANRIATAYIPASSTSVNPISTMMRFKFTAVTNNTSITPILNQYTVKAIMYPEIKSVIYAQVICAEDITCKNGMEDKNMYDTIIATLDNARNASWPVSIRDIDGNTQTVKLLPLPRSMQRYTITRDEKGREKERQYNLMMQVVSLS